MSLEAVKLMAAVCLVPDGHDKVGLNCLNDPTFFVVQTLEAITVAGEVNGMDRFQPIVQGKCCESN